MHKQSSGFEYSGQWHNDMKNGYGKNVWPDGSWYKGHYKDGMQHGQGKFVIAFRAITLYSYQGEWKNGKQDGEGYQID